LRIWPGDAGYRDALTRLARSDVPAERESADTDAPLDRLPLLHPVGHRSHS